MVHALGRIGHWLDHVIGLGANGLALQPVFAAQSHGYDTVDYYRVDPRLGDDADLAALFGAAHDRGIRVLLDGVFNHVGSGHPAFADVVAHGPDSRYADWFKVRYPDGWASGQTPDYDCFEGHSQLVTLNHDNPAVVDLVVDVMCHWLDRGADGWRLDAAYAVPTAFWDRVLPRVRKRFPQAYVVAEVIHGDYPGFVADSGTDSVTQYELWKAIWSSLRERNFWELDHALTRHDEFLDHFVPWTFVGNHDVTRIASQLDDERLLPLATAILMTVGGTPAVYYGDEFGLPGVKADRLGGDDAIRPEFPAEPAPPQGFSPEALRVHQELIAVRRRNPWLHQARTERVRLENELVAYRVSDGEHALLVALNSAELPATIAEVTGRLEAGAGALDASGLTLDGFGWAVVAP